MSGHSLFGEPHSLNPRMPLMGVILELFSLLQNVLSESFSGAHPDTSVGLLLRQSYEAHSSSKHCVQFSLRSFLAPLIMILRQACSFAKATKHTAVVNTAFNSRCARPDTSTSLLFRQGYESTQQQ
jgi:hypothetical protein